MIDDINTREKGHILTIEDPIEFVHARKNCLISQREIGVHAGSFSSALLSALREDPDVILVGELRDLETMSIAVTAAEMGILVMGTLHTNGAAATVDRLVNAFPADKQPHVRTMLSTSLRGVVSQQLIPKADKKGRVAALEILINTPAIANLIRQGKMDQLENGMQTGAASGMRLMDTAIQALLDQRLISGNEAYKKAINKSSLRAISRGRLRVAPRRSSRPLNRRRGITVAMAAHTLRHHAPCPTPTARSTSGTSWSTSRPISGSASSACAATTCYFVCADDAHGAPIMLKAEAEGITPQALVARIAADRPRYLDGVSYRLRSLVFDGLTGEHGALPGHLPPAEGRGTHLRQARSSSSTIR